MEQRDCDETIIRANDTITALIAFRCTAASSSTLDLTWTGHFPASGPILAMVPGSVWLVSLGWMSRIAMLIARCSHRWTTVGNGPTLRSLSIEFWPAKSICALGWPEARHSPTGWHSLWDWGYRLGCRRRERRWMLWYSPINRIGTGMSIAMCRSESGWMRGKKMSKMRHVSKETGGGWVASFILRCDARVRVLMITFGKVLTDDGFLAGFAAVKDFVNQRGPHHGITDLSQVECFEVSNELLNAIGSMSPAFPTPMRRLVVASTPAAYVCTRIVQMLRSGSSAPIEVVATIDKSCAMLGTSSSNLIDV
jgi:hypothetical protein